MEITLEDAMDDDTGGTSKTAEEDETVAELGETLVIWTIRGLSEGLPFAREMLLVGAGPTDCTCCGSSSCGVTSWGAAT